MHMTVRLSKEMPEADQRSYIDGLQGAFTAYAVSNPMPGHGQPQVLIEPLITAVPYTADGDVRGMVEPAINDWWTGGILAVMEKMQEQSEGRGVVLFTETHVKYQIPPLDSWKVA